METSQSHKLLLVDDVPENNFVLENILEAPDREFIKANSGDEALKLLLKYDIDIILLDVQMPGMDGFETARLIRGAQRTRHIPIIFVTAINKEEKHIFKGYESGAVDYMFKPLEPVIVKSKVKILLELAEQRRLLARQNEELLTAKRNAESIFSNVEEGICIVDTNLIIQPQYSKALEDILLDKTLANTKITEVFSRHMDEKLLNDTCDYFDLMLNQNISEMDLEELNPLHNIQYKQELDINDKRFTKCLDFKLKRIIAGENITGLLITVTDQTAQMLLKKQLKLAEEKTKRNYELVNILKVEPLLVKEFLKQSEREIKNINDCLKDFSKSKKAVEDIDCIYRLIHSIKGNAGLLGLEFISQKAHDFEQIITDSSHDADSFISKKTELFVIINQLLETIHEIHGFIGIMKNFYENYNQEKGNKSELLIDAIYGLLNKTKADGNHQVKLNYRDFDAGVLPPDSFLDVKDILVQLTRNSLAHNLNESNISKSGLNIKLASEMQKDDVIIVYEDDGIGLQYDKIRQKALEQKKFSNEELDQMSQNEVAELIFNSGLSTTDEADLESGRGMGMCIIKQKIDELGGRIEIDSQEGKYCAFRIFIPKQIAVPE